MIFIVFYGIQAFLKYWAALLHVMICLQVQSPMSDFSNQENLKNQYQLDINQTKLLISICRHYKNWKTLLVSFNIKSVKRTGLQLSYAKTFLSENFIRETEWWQEL